MGQLLHLEATMASPKSQPESQSKSHEGTIMKDNSELEMTQLLVQLGKTNPDSKPEVFDAIFKKLRQIAHRYMRLERPEHTLQATAVVNEAYIRLMQGGEMNWQNR